METPRTRISKKMREQVYERYDGHCAYCGVEIEYKDMQVDHMVPLRKGGSNDIGNLLPACRSCNNYKHTLTVKQFRQYINELVHRLYRDSATFRTAARFGRIWANPDGTVFYFEKPRKKCNVRISE